MPTCPRPGATAAADLEGDIWFNGTLAHNTNPIIGQAGVSIIVHEIGHAIGLSHPGIYNGGVNGGATYQNDADHWQDTTMFTAMSYFGAANTGGNLGSSQAAPQLHDIAAAQRLYGANMTTRTGDTIYGFNSNTGHQHFTITASNQSPVFAIWDAGGVDTIDFSGYFTATEIDLREEAFSNAGPGAGGVGLAIGNVAIARGAVIENAIGGAGNDTIIGNGADNVLTGRGGADSINGGDGVDTANYAGSTGGVSVNLASGVGLGGDAQGDTLAFIENLVGSALADTLIGSSIANTLNGGGGGDQLSGGDSTDALFGGDGDDVLVGGAGGDTFGGGAGSDTAEYTGSAAAVTIDLLAGTGLGGDAAGDVLASIEIVIGSAFSDVLSGRDFVTDTLNGGDGDDVLMGRYGGDVLNGGAGVDTLSYSNSLTGVDVRLFSGLALGGEANGDTYSGIENIIGTATRTDTLAGDDNANFIWGGGGNETITGRDGSDRLFGEAGNDTLLGGAADDVLVGGAGNDTLGGGGGADTADYSASAAGVTVHLQAGTGAGGDAAGDALVSIENVIGSANADTIAGKNNFNNVLDGGAGADTLSGGAGNDTFVFRAGEAGGDSVLDFNSAGVGDNDSFLFLGYGTIAAGASFVQIDATHWQINSADGLTQDTIIIANGATIDPSDFLFG